MEGKYPIMIDDALWGELSVREQGKLTRFSVRCRMREGIFRISVYGGGREGKLGVLMPGEDGFLRLEKRLSPNDMRLFPAEIEHVGLSDEVLEVFAEEAKAETEVETPAPEPAPEPESEPDSEPHDELYWYSSPDGALVCFDGERSLIAFQPGDERIPAEPKGSRKMIDGREYLVYITKDGRIVG